MSIRIRVLGSGREVGRSAILVESSKGNYLLDYGVLISEEDIPLLPLSVAPSKLSCVVITHAHLDHVGAAPMLYISGKVPLLTTPITRDISEVMIEDMLKISGYYLPFEHLELRNILSNTIVRGYREPIEIGGAVIELIYSGHIPGSAMVKLSIGSRTILYTGDVNTIETRLVGPADISGIEADTLIIEGTYGDTDHPERSRVESKFIDTVLEVLDDGGTVLIPAFSLGRSQEILADQLSWFHFLLNGLRR